MSRHQPPVSTPWLLAFVLLCSWLVSVDALPLALPQTFNIAVHGFMDPQYSDNMTYRPSQFYRGAMEQIPASRLALKVLAERFPWMLRNKTLKLQFWDSRGERSATVHNSIRMMDANYATHPADAVVGFFDSLLAQAGSIVASFYNVPVLSAYTTDQSLSDKSVYPTYSRLLPSDQHDARAMMKLVKHFGWTRVGVVYAETLEPFFAEWETLAQAEGVQFKAGLVRKQTNFIFSVGREDDMRIALRQLRDNEFRVIVLAFNRDDVAVFDKVATELGMKGSEFAYLGIRQWLWDLSIPKLFDLSGVLGTSMWRRSSNLDRFVELWKETYAEDPDAMFGLPEPNASANQFDAILLIAKMIGRLAELDEWCNASGTRTLHTQLPGVEQSLNNASVSFTCGNLTTRRERGLLLVSLLRNSSVQEVVSPVTFDANGDVTSGIVYVNVRGTKLVDVGDYSQITGGAVLGSTVWFRGNSTDVPSDSLTVVEERVSVPERVVVTVLVFAGFAFLYGVALLVFNVHYRKNPYIRMSSPLFNSLVIVGCLMALGYAIAEAVLELSDTNQRAMEALCTTEHWILPMAFTLGWGALFAKSWRVYRLFGFLMKSVRSTSKRGGKHKNHIHDSDLLAIVAMQLLVDVIILSIWTGVNPVYRKTAWGSSRVNPLDGTQKLQDVTYSCTTDNIDTWVWLLASYKGILLAFGGWLAWETRKVDIAALNDAKLIAFCIYITLVIGAICFPAFWFLEDATTRFIVQQASLLLLVFSVLSIIFVPKVFVVVRGKSNRKVRRNSTITKEVKPTVNFLADLQAEKAALEEKVEQLQGNLQSCIQHTSKLVSSTKGSSSVDTTRSSPLDTSASPLDTSASPESLSQRGFVGLPHTTSSGTQAFPAIKEATAEVSEVNEHSHHSRSVHSSNSEDSTTIAPNTQGTSPQGTSPSAPSRDSHVHTSSRGAVELGHVGGRPRHRVTMSEIRTSSTRLGGSLARGPSGRLVLVSSSSRPLIRGSREPVMEMEIDDVRG